MNLNPPIVLVAVLTTGCSQYEYIVIDAESPERAVDSLAVGDVARIVTNDGKEIVTTVKSVEDDVVVGNDEQVTIDDIATISIQQFKGAGDVDELTAGISQAIWSIALLGFLIASIL